MGLPKKIIEDESNPALDPRAGSFEVIDGEDEDEEPGVVEAAWAAEIERRVEEIRNGTAELYDVDDVLAEMEERFG